MTRRKCPAATGLLGEDRHCLVSGAEHRCMLPADPHHWAHNCLCGTGWASNLNLVDGLRAGKANT